MTTPTRHHAPTDHQLAVDQAKASAREVFTSLQARATELGEQAHQPRDSRPIVFVVDECQELLAGPTNKDDTKRAWAVVVKHARALGVAEPMTATTSKENQ